MRNLFAPQAKPVPFSLPFTNNQQQQLSNHFLTRTFIATEQIPSYQFGSQPAIFKQEPAIVLDSLKRIQTNKRIQPNSKYRIPILSYWD